MSWLCAYGPNCLIEINDDDDDMGKISVHDNILTKNLHKEKEWKSKKILHEFPQKKV